VSEEEFEDTKEVIRIREPFVA